MIEVRSEPIVECDSEGGWTLVLWMGQPFDYDTPFRDALREVAEVLSPETRGSVELPNYEVGEDFVRGTLRIGGEALRVYYEHSLGYLSLSSERQDALHDVSRRLRPIVKVASSLRPSNGFAR
jgi:hypothetical protein